MAAARRFKHGRYLRAFSFGSYRRRQSLPASQTCGRRNRQGRRRFQAGRRGADRFMGLHHPRRPGIAARHARREVGEEYVGPQVWATRPGRAKTLAALVDHLICIHDFEAPFYQPFGLPVTVSGAPALSRVKRGDATGFRARHGIAENQDVLLLLPGSRRAEIENVAPVLEEGRGAGFAKPEAISSSRVSPRRMLRRSCASAQRHGPFRTNSFWTSAKRKTCSPPPKRR